MYTDEYKDVLKGEGHIVFDGEDQLLLSPTATILLEGDLVLNGNRIAKNGRSSILKMDEGSKLVTKGQFKFMYGADILLFKDSTLILGANTYINYNSMIRCAKQISIGNNCAIAAGFTVFDSDWHSINGKKRIEEVEIGDNVWIGVNVTVLRGVRIGSGSVIAAGSVVTKSIPDNCLAAGVPAVVKKTGIKWEL